MPSCSTMILRSLRLIGEKTRGATLTSAEQTECLAEINSMLDSWSQESLMIHTYSVTNFALTASQGSYTIGSGGNFNMTRPTRIVDPCYLRDSDSNDTPVKILDATAYGRITDKDVDASYPKFLYYDMGYSATSTATLFIWPEPQSNLTLFINTLQPFVQFSTMTHNISLPPGYQRAIEYNYAVESAGGFTEVDPSVAMIAKESKASIKRLNNRAPVMTLEGSGYRSTIITGP